MIVQPTHNTPSINDLPNEILLCIFKCVRPAYSALGCENWMQRLLVCRRWRDVVVSTTSLWSDIYVSSEPKWLDLCLSRCANGPANLFFFRRCSIDRTVPILRRYSNIIKEIHYRGLHRRWMVDIEQILKIPMPALVSFEILNALFDRSEASVKLENLPRLRNLTLNMCVLDPNDTPRLATLRSLSLVSACRLGPAVTFEEFMNVLADSSGLEALELGGTLQDLRDCPQGYARDHPTLRPPITLERLRELRIRQFSCALTSHVLARLHLPNAVLVRIALDEVFGYTFPGLSSFLPDNVPVAFPLVSATTSLSIRISRADCVVFAKGSSSSFSLSLLVCPDTHASFDYILRVFASASVTELKFEAERLYGYYPSTWKEAFRSLPRLRHLCISERSGITEPSRVLAGLELASEADSSACCPGLVAMTIGTRDNLLGVHHTTYRRIVTFLRRRADQGAQLERVELFLSHRNPICGAGEEIEAALESLTRTE
ncbi:hypothetical protein L226DRAFT_562765 [Lentinus tigrinus ALCF2SS1-7]|uniref:F-box domain-containing protein n=1 Tax=Lentinus tigrinus ALCF2SS1-6 TaxID=1328759 RepID=A0A5C2RRY8_9APHY|nr:hypothetical protein L227DRAFT_657932 [Lentinus tigrinus ALCF2SS1-6]RPD70594.1 hypothetical protein L226DRAFT_562765 [Lentinus tigrinus ALCF2SS1-7]